MPIDDLFVFGAFALTNCLFVTFLLAACVDFSGWIGSVVMVYEGVRFDFNRLVDSVTTTGGFVMVVDAGSLPVCVIVTDEFNARGVEILVMVVAGFDSNCANGEDVELSPILS